MLIKAIRVPHRPWVGPTLVVSSGAMGTLLDPALETHGAITFLLTTGGALIGGLVRSRSRAVHSMEGMLMGTWAAGLGTVLGSMGTLSSSWSVLSMIWMSGFMGGMVGGSTADWIRHRQERPIK